MESYHETCVAFLLEIQVLIRIKMPILYSML